MHSFKKLKWSFLHVIKFLFLAIGKSWNDFYGWMLNYQDRKITIEEILSRTNVDGKYKGLWGEMYEKGLSRSKKQGNTAGSI